MFKILKRKKDNQDEEKGKVGSKSQKSASRRKKKESPKPWGKKERLLILFILIITMVSSLILAMQSRSWKLPGLPKLSLPKISFFEGETIVIEGNKIQKQEYDQSQEIVADFKSTTDGYSGIYSLYVYSLDQEYSFGVNKRDEQTAASLIKLPVMIGLYLEEEKGNIDLDDVYSLKNEDRVSGAGSLYNKSEGYKISYRELIALMGNQSDNTAFRIAVNLLGEEKIEEYIKEIGMTHTSYEDNITTPEDVGLLLTKLWQGELISKVNKQELLEYLSDTVFEQWLVAGIPDSVIVPHKFGREVHVVNDAGIVLTDNPYVVVLMTQGVIEREADELIPTLSKNIFERMSN